MAVHIQDARISSTAPAIRFPDVHSLTTPREYISPPAPNASVTHKDQEERDRMWNECWEQLKQLTDESILDWKTAE